jgi:hypothetical protein
MDRTPLALLAGILGGVGGALAVRYAVPAPAPAATVAPAPADDPGLKEVKDQLAEVRRLLEGREAASLAAATDAKAAARLGSSAGGTLTVPQAEAIARAAAEKAAEAVATRLATEGAAKPVARAEKKRVPLAEISRDIGLSAAQETEIRDAYRDATEKFLKVFAEPDGDVEALRRELTEAKGNKAKGQALVMKHMPKLFTKMGDVMAIQAERDARIEKALGSEENQAKFHQVRVEEEDPFGLDGSVSVGATVR